MEQNIFIVQNQFFCAATARYITIALAGALYHGHLDIATTVLRDMYYLEN
jgi:hypothetical protein